MGHFIDVLPSDLSVIEMRALLGPNGLLVANLQNAAGDPLPGIVGMTEPSSPEATPEGKRWPL